MEAGAHTTYVAYRLLPGARGDWALRVHLLASARNHHVTTDPDGLRLEVGVHGAGLVVRAPESGADFTLRLLPEGGHIVPDATWYRNFLLGVEQERGLPALENYLCVGELHLDLPPDTWVGLVASLSPQPDTDLEAALVRFRQREAVLLDRAKQVGMDLGQAALRQLVLAADSFLFTRPLPGMPDGEAVIAGYPWFGEWGRDTLIALPGLTLATGRADSARRILTTFTRFVDQGMLPNVFSGSGEQAAYNTVDAALWFFVAWHAYLDATGDLETVRAAFPVLADMVQWHLRGTRYGIAVAPVDGLLRAGEPGVQLTWMDAKVGDWVVTPRQGKPVEINALWYNALRVMAGFARRLGLAAEEYEGLAERVRQSFRRFLRPDGQGLYDVLDGPAGDDSTLRPNQIFALSLSYSPLDGAAQRQVLEVCRAQLLTSYGLRSLDPTHPDYRPHYQGGVQERDGTYHQGTVWSWLLGHYALALARVSGDRAAACGVLEPLYDHLTDAALGTLSEIFDGAPPHLPRGAPAQAWSVACLLEAWWRLNQPTAAESDL
jgi:4-alpha-glucanotransferase